MVEQVRPICCSCQTSDENVDYERIFPDNPFHVALIALSGPFIANGLLFIFSYWLLQKKAIQQKPYLYYFIFWFNIMNIANLDDDVPLRTFAGLNWDTDMSNLERGLGDLSLGGVYSWWVSDVVFVLDSFSRKHLLKLTFI